MARELSIEIIDECIERLAHGETIDDCLKSFPQYADELRPMLEATRVPRQAWVSPEVVAQSQARVGLRFEQALNSPTATYRTYPLRRIASFILFLLFLGSLLTTGVVVAAQDSIPGDRLYTVKLVSEQVRLFVATDKKSLEETFAKRRIDETKRVLELRREVSVQFVGIIDALEDMTIDVAGLKIEVAESVRTIDLMMGMRIAVSARSRADQTLLATDIRVLDLTESTLQFDIISSATPTVTRENRASVTPTDLTPTPSATSPSRETATLTASTIPDSRPTRRPTQSPIGELPRASSDCDRPPPSNWIRYTIQPGDTPSGIAVGTGITLDEFFTVNCNLDRRIIIAGQVVLVPYTPRLQITPTELARTPISEVTYTPSPDMRPPTNDNAEHPTEVTDREEDKDSSGNSDKKQGDRRR